MATLRGPATTNAAPLELAQWRARWDLDKYHGDLWGEGLDAIPYESTVIEHNLLMYGGASCIWECLIGNGTATAAQTLTYFSNAEARLGTGTSSTAEAATQTDLQTAGVRVAMSATYPSHADATTSGAASCQWKSSFDTATGNQAWNEVALFNASSGGRMLNRKVVALGTKTNADTWNLSLTITLA
jgi:hypothetical protein